MADTTMIPFASDTGWDAGVGGAIGAALGNWFFNGGFGGYGGRGVAGQAVADTAVIDGLNRISEQVSGVNTAVFESAAGISRDLGTGFNAVSRDVRDASSLTNQNLCSGFANTVATINANGTAARFDTMNGFNQTQRAIDSCCCATQTSLANGFGKIALEDCQNTGRIVSAIGAEGSATRALINQNYINDLQSQLCDAKSKIGSLESQQFTANALASQSAIFDRKLADAITTIINGVKGTTTTA